MKSLFLSMLMLFVSSLFAVTDSGGGGMDSGGGNAFRLSEKTIIKYIQGDLKSNVVLTLQALEKIYKTEKRVPYSTTIKNDSESLKALATLFDSNNFDMVLRDVEVSKYDLINGPCLNRNQQISMSSTNYGEQGGSICLSLPLIHKTTLKHEELAYENALVALLIHEHLHHFQKLSERENEIEGDAIQALVLLAQVEVKLEYPLITNSKKIAQLFAEKMAGSLEVRSNRFVSLQAKPADQVFIKIKLHWAAGSRCVGRPFDPNAFYPVRLFTTAGSTFGSLKEDFGEIPWNSGTDELVVEVPTQKIAKDDLLVLNFDQHNNGGCSFEHTYTVTVIKNNQIISQRNEMPDEELGDPSRTDWGLRPNYYVYLF